jgi:hypothetical protein
MSRIMTAANQSSLIRLAAALPKGDESRRVILARLKIALRLKQFEALMGMGKKFGVLSAYGDGSKNENQRRNGELFQELQKRGYRKIIPLRGSWQGVAEKSVLVPGMKWQDLLDLGKRFDQDSVIYKDPSGVVGMYYQKDGQAEFAVADDGSIAAVWDANKEHYSKARGISFEFGFLWGQKVPWNGSSPYTRKGLGRLLERGQLSP